MISVKCLVGTASFDGLSYTKGEVFETSDEMANHLIEHRIAELVPEPELSGGAEIVGIVDNLDETITDVPPPDASWTIADIKGWMDAQNAGYPASASKAHLLDLVAGLDET